MFAGVAAVAGLVAISIVGSRQIASEDRDQLTLAALGLTRRQHAVAAAAIVLPAAVVGAALAVVVAAASSPSLPFGVAREAEVDPGLRLDWPVLGLGFVAILASVAIVAAIAGMRVARAPDPARAGPELPRPSVAARVAAAAGLKPTTTTGLRMALEQGRGRNTVPVRSAFVGAVLGTMGVVAVLTFSFSLDHLAATPRLYGWSFDSLLFGRGPAAQQGASAGPCRIVSPVALHDKRLSALATICINNVEIDGRPTTGWGFAPERGSLGPEVVTGRARVSGHEVALGASTLDGVHKHIGQSVRIRYRKHVRQYRVVGQVVFPSPATADPQTLADGAAFTKRGMLALGQDTNDTLVALFAPLQPGHARGCPRRHRREVEHVQEVPPRRDRGAPDSLRRGRAAPAGRSAAAGAQHPARDPREHRRRPRHHPRNPAAASRSGSAAHPGLRTPRRAVDRAAPVDHARRGRVAGRDPAGHRDRRAVWRAIADGLGVQVVFSLSVLAVVSVVIGALLVTTLIGVFAARAAVRMSPAGVLRTE